MKWKPNLKDVIKCWAYIVKKQNLWQFTFLLIFNFPVSSVSAQTPIYDSIENDLVRTSAKIFPFYYQDFDSLEYYSNFFSTKLTNFIYSNAATLTYPFKMLIDSNACDIVTSNDGLFRIYSWDTWLGGTMHIYRNIYQFKSGNQIFSTNLGYGEEDIGSYYSNIFTIKAPNKTYYLALCGGSFSSKDKYQSIGVYSIDNNNVLNDTVAIIKTKNGLVNSISVEYDISSIDTPEWPIQLIKYDAEKKTIYIPVVLEDGKVTDRFILYQFTGKYFEKILTQKKIHKQK